MREVHQETKINPAQAAQWSTPTDNPYYPPLPAHYRNLKLQFVFFRADSSSVGRLLPAPLEPAEDGDCVACGLDAPFTSSYGQFQEAFTLLKCTFRGKTGWYCSHVFHNGPAGIAAGREVYGTPKIWSDLSVRQTDRMMVTTAHMGGLPAITVATVMDDYCERANMPSLTPSWRLKLIPRADGPGPAIKQLIDCADVAKDMKVHQMMKGSGTVHFDASPMCDLTGLKPIEYSDAFYMVSSFAEDYARIEYDYLTDGQP